MRRLGSVSIIWQKFPADGRIQAEISHSHRRTGFAGDRRKNAVLSNRRATPLGRVSLYDRFNIMHPPATPKSLLDRVRAIPLPVHPQLDSARPSARTRYGWPANADRRHAFDVCAGIPARQHRGVDRERAKRHVRPACGQSGCAATGSTARPATRSPSSPSTGSGTQTGMLHRLLVDRDNVQAMSPRFSVARNVSTPPSSARNSLCSGRGGKGVRRICWAHTPAIRSLRTVDPERLRHRRLIREGTKVAALILAGRGAAA